MILIHLGEATLRSSFMNAVLPNSGYNAIQIVDMRSKFKLGMVLCSPLTLCRILELSRLPKGHRAIFRNGTQGALHCGSKLINHSLTPDMQWRQAQQDITGCSPIPFFLIHPEEYKETTMATDYWMVNIAKRLFDVTLEVSYTGSDGAERNGCDMIWSKHYKTLVSTLNCNFHVQKNLACKTNDSNKLKGHCKTDLVKSDGPDQMNNLPYCPTKAMFKCCLDLVLKGWKESGEDDASVKGSPIKYVLDYYGRYPRNTWSWYYGVTGTQDPKIHHFLCLITPGVLLEHKESLRRLSQVLDGF
jgi:hypothetical protein